MNPVAFLGSNSICISCRIG